MNLELYGKYLNGFGEFVRIVYPVMENSDHYKKGYRFKDSFGRFYFTDGRATLTPSVLDITGEMTDPTVDQIPFDNLAIGDKVISFLDREGKITAIHPDIKSKSGQDPDYQYIEMTWEGLDQKSYQALSNLDNVRYVGR